MKRRRVIVVLAGCLVCAVVAVAMWPGEREPFYKGKELSEWVTVFATANFPGRGAEAADAIRHIGTNANPYLLRWISYEQPTWKRKLSARYKKWPGPLVNNSILGWLLGVREERRAEIATVAFGMLGPGGLPAVPELNQIMQKNGTGRPSERATVALGLIEESRLRAEANARQWLAPRVLKKGAQTNGDFRHEN